MKDQLDREIVVGDTLAYAGHYVTSPNYPQLKLAKVLATAAFAIEVEDIAEKDAKRWVASNTKTFVICDWAKGSDAAK